MPKSVFQFPFDGGLDEKTRAELLEPGAWTTLLNVLSERKGAKNKRHGNIALSTALVGGGTLAAGKKLIAYNQEQLVIDGRELYAWSASKAAYAPIDAVPEAFVMRDPLVTGGTLRIVSMDVVNGLVGLTWTDQSSPTQEFSQVIDQATGAVVVPLQRMHTFDGTVITTVDIVAVGTTFVWIGVNNTGGNSAIYVRTLDTTAASPAWTAEIQIATDVTNPGLTSLLIPIEVITDGMKLFIAYINTNPVAHVTVLAFTVAPWTAAGSVQTGGGVSNSVQMGLATNATGLWLGLADLGVGLYLINPGTMTVTAFNAGIQTVTDSRQTIGLYVDASNNITVVYETVGTTPPVFFHTRILQAQYSSGTFTITHAVQSWPDVTVASRPFTYNGRVYCWVRSTTGSDAFLVDLTFPITRPTLRDIARPGIRLVNGQSYRIATLGSGKFASALRIARTTFSDGIEFCTVDFESPLRFSSARSAQTLAVGDGTPATFDGKRVADCGFSAIPHIAIGVISGTMTGTWSYVQVWEWFDAQGLRDQSAPSVAVSVTLTAQNAQVQMSMLPIDSKTGAVGTRPRAVLYRTTNGGQTYYRVVGSETPNDPTHDTVTYLDSMADSQLSANEPLYFQPGLQGGRLAKFSPPSLTVVCTHRDRIFGIADDGITLWWTGQNVLGERPWWTDQFQLPIPDGGRAYALASLEGRLFVFKQNSIFVVDGDGPPDNGIGGDYVATDVPSDVGCTNPRSIVVTPDGIVFQGAGPRLYMLTRALQVVYIGRPVQATFEANPVVTSAVLDRQHGRILLTCVPTDGAATGVTLVWDYLEQVWSVHEKYDADTAQPSASAASAALIGGTSYCWLTYGGRTYQEDPVNYLDAGATWVGQTIETPNIKLAGLQGYQKVFRLSVMLAQQTQHALRVSIAYDFSTTYDHVEEFLDTELQELANDREQLVIVPSQQTVQAIRVKLEELAPTVPANVGSGQGAVFLGLAFEVATKTGVAKRFGTAAR